MDYSIKTYFYDSHVDYLLTNYRQAMNTFTVKPTYYRRLTHFGQQCNSRVRPLFDDSITDDCILDCLWKKSIHAFNCTLYSYYSGSIRWEKDIMESKPKFCDYTKISWIMHTKIVNYNRACFYQCLSDCEVILMKITPIYDFHKDYHIEQDKFMSITIIPKSQLIVKYEEKYVMDGWELIYQLGGMFGNVGWDGLLFLYQVSDCQKIKYYIFIIILKILRN